MNRSLSAIVCLVLLIILSAGTEAGEKQKGKSGEIFLTPDNLKWNDGLVVLEGDPKKSGFFVMRLKLPAGSKIAPHMHNIVERVTVISGKLNLAKGEKAENPKVLPAGSYFSFQPGMAHSAGVDVETVVQISTEGPWTFKPLN